MAGISVENKVRAQTHIVDSTLAREEQVRAKRAQNS